MKRLFQDKRQKWIYLAMIGFVTVLVLHYFPISKRYYFVENGNCTKEYTKSARLVTGGYDNSVEYSSASKNDYESKVPMFAESISDDKNICGVYLVYNLYVL